jgi:hypothetical protein
VNLSSVSWIILRLLVEFPNEVPKKASFSHTLAAKAVDNGRLVLMIHLDTSI